MITHAILRAAQKSSGYDFLSLGEYLLPLDLSVIIHVASRTTFMTQGLLTLYEHDLLSWLDSAALESFACNFDPSCSQQGGSCHTCTHLPLGCETHNHGLSRAYLHGGQVSGVSGHSLHVRKGFWT